MAAELRVLVGEGQEETRLLSAALLERHGLRVCGLARDGLEALARIRTERPDAVVLRAVFRLAPGDPDEIRQQMRELMSQLGCVDAFCLDGGGSTAMDVARTARRLGAEEKLVSRSAVEQVALAFLLPLGLALVHTVVGMKAANDLIAQAAKVDSVQSALVTALVLLLVYGGYFLATSLACRRLALDR